MTSQSKVMIIRSSYSEISDTLLKILDIDEFDPSGFDRILLKLNLCEFRTPETGAITHPYLVESLLSDLVSRYPKKEFFLVESDATVTNADLFMRWFGFERIASKYKAACVNLSKVDSRKKRINGLRFSSVKVPNILEGSYVISLPKLKTSCVTKVSLSLKNQFGCIQHKKKIDFHDHLDDAIVDANIAMPAHFSIVDGIVGMGGPGGPSFGVPIWSNVVIGGADPVAVDTVCSKVMGFRPLFIGHIRKASRKGLGSMSLKVEGDSIRKVRRNFEYDSFETWLLSIGMKIRERSQERWSRER